MYARKSFKCLVLYKLVMKSVQKPTKRHYHDNVDILIAHPYLCVFLLSQMMASLWILDLESWVLPVAVWTKSVGSSGALGIAIAHISLPPCTNIHTHTPPLPHIPHTCTPLYVHNTPSHPYSLYTPTLPHSYTCLFRELMSMRIWWMAEWLFTMQLTTGTPMCWSTSCQRELR